LFKGGLTGENFGKKKGKEKDGDLVLKEGGEGAGWPPLKNAARERGAKNSGDKQQLGGEGGVVSSLGGRKAGPFVCPEGGEDYSGMFHRGKVLLRWKKREKDGLEQRGSLKSKNESERGEDANEFATTGADKKKSEKSWREEKGAGGRRGGEPPLFKKTRVRGRKKERKKGREPKKITPEIA